MELFVSNRYDPEEKQSRIFENKIAEGFIKKIESRKRELQNKQNNISECDEPSLKKPKKQERKKKKKKITSSIPQNETVPVNYEILGNDNFKEKKKIKRVLPYWLLNPSVISVNLKNLSCDIKSIKSIDKKIINILETNNITHFFPVQEQIIPRLLASVDNPPMYWPSDICVSAPTGSGKTLAFVLPIVQLLYKKMDCQVRALVILPVQDLAKQVFSVFKMYAEPMGVKVLLLSASVPFPVEQKNLIRKEFGDIRSLVDVIVTTPGRLVDHLKNTSDFNLKYLEYLIIDEADRVMDGIQNDWLHHLNSHLDLKSDVSQVLSLNTLIKSKRPPRKLLFSATLSQNPEKLQQIGLFQPLLFTSLVSNHENHDSPIENTMSGAFIGKFTTPAELKEMYVKCDSLYSKPLILHQLLETFQWRGVLCFTKSKQAAHRLSYLLRYLSQGKLRVSEISAFLSPERRDAIIRKFSQGFLNVLVCSDALARGIDIKGVQCVVSYDCPKYIKNYVHRVGRTGRAGNEGTAVTLLLSKEMTDFHTMLSTAGKSNTEEITVKSEDLEKNSSLYNNALAKVKEKLNRSLNRLKSNKVQKKPKKICNATV